MRSIEPWVYIAVGLVFAAPQAVAASLSLTSDAVFDPGLFMLGILGASAVVLGVWTLLIRGRERKSD